MRLLSCQIENFGKLSGYKREFTDGCNGIIASNGRGKSTLAAFIRVMFYGFEGEGKRGALANERKRFEPWQGGVYGGRLTFREGDRTYTVSRTFGTKSSEDTFELRDALTNLVSDDYSENLGEQIFKVNAESYMRTAYIGQNDVVTHTTDGINAKIGNIVETTNDLESYEKAAARLNDLLNKNSPTRSTGSLSKLEDEVTRLRTGVREGSVILDSIHRLEDSMGSRQEEAKVLTDERSTLMKLQQEISTYKDRQAVKEQYEMIDRDRKQCEEELKERRRAFPGEIPTAEDLAIYADLAGEYMRNRDSMDFYAFNADEEDRYDKLKERFERGVPDADETDHLLRRWREHERSLSEDTGKRAELKVLNGEFEAAKKDVKTMPSSVVLAVAAILVAMIGAVASLLILPTNVFRWIGVAVSGLIFVGGTLGTVLGISRHRKECNLTVAEIEEDIAKLEGSIADGENKRNIIVEEIKDYLTLYKIHLDPASVTEDLGKLHGYADDYTRLEAKKADYVKALSAGKEKKNRLDGYLSTLSIVPGEDYPALIGRLTMDLRSYNEAKERSDAAESKVKEFTDSHDIEALKDLKKPESELSLEQIHERLDEISSRLDEISDHIKDENRQHDALAEKLEAWEEDQQTLSSKEQELVKGKHDYKNLKFAAKYLTQAKESITARYMEPLLTGFSKYYGSVSGTSADSFHIDANTNITVDELGSQRDTALLSTGYRDLIGFCMRLSLIDAMYEGEKPVLILDDPFVNLDSERLKGAQRLIETLAREYQLIYFTCR